METQNILYLYLFQFLGHLPTIIVYLIGIGFSFMNISKNPKISILSGIAFVILLVLSFLSAGTSLIPALLYNTNSYDAKNIGYVLYSVNIFFSIISAACFGLLIAAIWKDRKATL